MVEALEKQIEDYFNRPRTIDGRDHIINLGSPNERKKVETELDQDLVDTAAFLGSVWFNENIFFSAINHFTSAKEIKWGSNLPRNNRTDGEIHTELIIDDASYEFCGNAYEQDSAKSFVKRLVEGSIKPYNITKPLPPKHDKDYIC